MGALLAREEGKMELALQRVKDAQKLSKEVPELENVCNFDLG